MGLKRLAPMVVAVGVIAGCASQAGAPAVSDEGTRPASVKEAVVTAGVRVMPLGASVTWGTKSKDGNGYRQVLRQRLLASGLKVDFVGSRRSGTMADGQNEGHPGFRIDQIAAGADRWPAAAKPSIILLNAGTNDMIQNHDVPDAPARLHALIDELLRDRPTATILVSTLIPSPVAIRNERTDAFNAQLPAIVEAERQAGHRVYLVDLNRALTVADIGKDRIHPTESGYGKLAEAWYAVLAPILRADEHGQAAATRGAPSSTAVRR